MTDRPLDLYLDYDGTLVEIQSRPEEAVLSPARRGELSRLTRQALVCVVTGRSLSDIRRLIRLQAIGLIANHGMEMAANGRLWVHPQAAAARPALRNVLAKLRAAAASYPRLLIEDKGVTASIHLRRLDRRHVPAVERLVAGAVRAEDGRFRLTRGKEVLEIRPDVDWDKGRAVLDFRTLMGLPPRRTAIYIGDDRTDEDAFRALGPDALTFRVGPAGRSAARFRLVDVERVWDFLRAFTGP
jgi:trehalose 6-phosphate phosphatase